MELPGLAARAARTLAERDRPENAVDWAAVGYTRWILGGTPMLGSTTFRTWFVAALLVVAAAPAAHSSDSGDGDPPHTVLGPLDPRAIQDFWLAAPGSGAGGEWRRGSDFVSNGDLLEGDTPSGAAFTPDGTRLLVAHRDSKNVVVYDAATRDVLAVVALSGSPNDVAVSGDGAFAVTPNVFEDTASIIDLATATEVAVIPVGNQPGTARCSSLFDLAVIGNTIDASYSVLDLGSLSEARRINGVGFVGLVSVNFEHGAITAEFNPGEFVSPSVIVHADMFADQIKVVNILNGSVVTLPSMDS